MKFLWFETHQSAPTRSQLELIRASRLGIDGQWTQTSISVARRQIRLEQQHPIEALVRRAKRQYPYNTNGNPKV